MNPIFIRELKQLSRLKRTVVLLVMYNLLVTSLGFFAYYITFGTQNSAGTYQYSIGYAGYAYNDILYIYLIITAADLALLFLIIPAVTSGSISSEREHQTFDILVSTGISPIKIITGKILSSISMALLLVVSTLPVMALVFTIGGITLMGIIEFLCLIIVAAVFIASVGVFFSSICKTTTLSTICTYAMVMFLTIGNVFIVCGSDVIRTIKENGSFSSIVSTSAFGPSGIRSLLLLLNPVYSYAALMNSHTGNFADIFINLDMGSDIMYFCANHWFIISMCAQIFVSALIQILSAKKLNQ